MAINYLEVWVMSGEDLKDINNVHRMDPYVVVFLSGGSEVCTTVHENGGTNPSWIHRIAFAVDESSACDDLLNLEFKIMTQKTVGGDKEVGRAKLPVKELLEKQDDGKPKAMSCTVTLPSGKTQGVLKIYFKFGEALPAGGGYEPLGNGCYSARPAANQKHPKKSGARKLLRKVPGKTGDVLGVVVQAVAETLDNDT